MADSGTFLTTVLYTKHSKGTEYLVCDGGSHFHSSAAFLGRHIRNNFPMQIVGSYSETEREVNVVGPLCTPTDVLGQSVRINGGVVGDILAIQKSGAYGLTHSPIHFLSHETPAEILYDDGHFYVMRERKPTESLLEGQPSL